jgi:hypothetical protein
MRKKSARVVLTLFGSAAFGVGCTQAPPPPPPDAFTSQIDFEKDPEGKPEGEQPINGSGQPSGGATTGQGTQSVSTRHSSHYYHRGPSIWPLFWGMSRPSAPIYHPPSSVPRGPSHVIPPSIPSHANHASNATTHSPLSHPATTHTTPSHSASTHSSSTHAGSASHVSSRGFGSTGHAISGGS